MAGMDGDERFDLSAMNDDELYDVVMERLRESPEVDEGWIDVAVRDGHVTLSGTVGSDTEASVAEEIVAELVDADGLTSELVVSSVRRSEMPEAADDAVAADREVDDPLGEGEESQSDTAAHLAENLRDESFGTRDPGAAVEDGTSYIPPDRPMGDGYGSRERH